MLRARVATTLRNFKTPKCNVSREEKSALRSLKQKSKSDIVILSADKGNCTVIMNQTDYDQKAKALLNTDAYVTVRNDPTKTLQSKVQREWRAMKDKYAIPRHSYLKIYPSGSNLSRFYGLPKIHKENTPLRPIVSGCGSPTHKMAQHLAQILKPLAGNTDSLIRNSSHFAEEINNEIVRENEELVSFDVENMYGNINVDQAMEITGEYLSNDPTLKDRTPYSVSDILKLLNLCLKNTYFSYRGTIYKQVKGLSMGSPVSPIVADLFMEKWEQKALDSCPIEFKPRIWKRFKDDTFVIGIKDKSPELKAHLNQLDHDINVTSEIEKDGVLPHLDCYVIKELNGHLVTKVYRKPTHTNQYLNSQSNHPASSKRAVVYALMDRANKIPSKNEWKTEEAVTVKKALKMNGYSNRFIHKTLERRNQAPQNNERSISTAQIPYIKGLSERVCGILKDFKIRGVMRTQTLKDVLSHPKDAVPMGHKTGVIYKVACSGCPKVYIGETKRRLDDRIAEHKEACTNIALHEKSALGEHKYDSNHEPNWANVQIIDSQEHDQKRRVLETLHIRENDTINRNTGEEIDPIWINVLRSEGRNDPTSDDPA